MLFRSALLEQGDRKERLEAIDLPVAPGAPEYAGSYYSSELDVTYRVRSQGDRLLLARRRNPEQPLRATCRDGFDCDSLGIVEFTRDAKGHVDGMTVSTGRVLQLRFRKVP